MASLQICSTCGGELRLDTPAAFCLLCGAKLTEIQQLTLLPWGRESIEQAMELALQGGHCLEEHGLALALLAPSDAKDETLMDRIQGNQLIGFPQRPFYKDLAGTLMVWVDQQMIPRLPQVSWYAIQEVEEEMDRLDKDLTGSLLKMTLTWKDLSMDARTSQMSSLLDEIGWKGVRRMLGVRHTVGTVLKKLPPGLDQLLTSFNLPHTTGGRSKLTVGGRAMCKHAIRSSSRYFGEPHGPEDVKSQSALKNAIRILREAYWVNIHQLPHDIHVVEIRNGEGYGLRWLADGSAFRGFLEPSMEGGHEKGWRH